MEHNITDVTSMSSPAVPDVFSPQRFKSCAAAHVAERLPGCMRQRRASVLAAARRRMATEGYERFTLRTLAIDCDTTVQTVYNLIGNKTEVLTEAIADYGRALAETVGGWRNHPYRILELIEVIWQGTILQPEYMRQASLGYADLDRIWHGSIHRAGVRFVEICLADVRHNLRQSIDYRALADAMNSAIATAMQEWARDKVDVELLRANLFNRSGLLLLGALQPTETSRLERWFRQPYQPSPSCHFHR